VSNRLGLPGPVPGTCQRLERNQVRIASRSNALDRD
jgi:hypothetical protein